MSSTTRALDKPDIPLLISSVRFAVNILLDFLILSRWRVGGLKPTFNTQAWIRLACELVSAFAGLGYFLFTTSLKSARTAELGERKGMKPTWRALGVLIRPGG